jgi:ferredoxin
MSNISKVVSTQPSAVSTPPNETISGALATKQIGKYQVTVIRDKCISAASCVAIAPGVFQLDEEQLAVVLSQDGADDEMKLLAAQSCPTMAIIVVDTETGKQVWPVE